MSKAIGLTLTITGLMLAWYCVQVGIVPGPAPLPVFVIAAIAVAMLAVGIRYILKGSPKDSKAGKKKSAKQAAGQAPGSAANKEPGG